MTLGLHLEPSRLRTLLVAAASRRIVVIGDAMLDVYLVGDVDRISPEAPVPVVRVRERREALGGAANVAQNVVAIGAQCRLICTIGADLTGATLRRMLRLLPTADDAVVVTERRTTEKTRVLARAQQLLRIDEEEDGDLAPAEIAAVIEAIERAVADADAVILEDYNKGVLAPAVIDAAIRLARARNIPIVVDPKFRNFFRFQGATVFKPNRRELESAFGASLDVDHPEMAPAVLAQLGAEHLLLTLGDEGMALFSADGSVLRVATAARAVYDVVGAGDTVTAYLAAILAAGGTPLEAAIIANLAAGIEVGKLGAASVTPSEIFELVESYPLG